MTKKGKTAAKTTTTEHTKPVADTTPAAATATAVQPKPKKQSKKNPTPDPVVTPGPTATGTTADKTSDKTDTTTPKVERDALGSKVGSETAKVNAVLTKTPKTMKQIWEET